MSLEKTADIFKNKSEEEIMNWMIKNMTPEQIKSCFEGELPDKLDEVEKTPEETLLDLRKFCSDKRYIIHKIVGDKVWFWYFESGKWEYYNKPFEHFKEQDGIYKECGDDTLVDEDIKDLLKREYNLNDDIEFNKVKQEYIKMGINKNWIDNLLTAIEIQKNIPVTGENSFIINFTPVLIESSNQLNVNYYYLVNNDGELLFKEGNLPLDKLKKDFTEVLDELNLQILIQGQPGGTSAKTIEEWKSEIKAAAEKIDSNDLKRIKKLYNNFPLSESSTFFMNNLFEDSNFGKVNNLNLSNYIENNFGTNTARLFNPQVVSNKFGMNTIALVSK